MPQATWNNYKTGSAWGTAGAKSASSDFYPDVYSESTSGVFDITALVRAALGAGQTDLVLLVVDPAPVAKRYAAFYSSDTGNLPWAPRLRVEGSLVQTVYAYGPEVAPGVMPPYATSMRTCTAEACHSLAKAATPEFAPTCVSCHPSRALPHGYAPAAHAATVGNRIERHAGFTCAACHSMDLMTEHAKPSSSSAAAGCNACHLSLVPGLIALGGWDGTCAQGGCHTAGSSAPMHTVSSSSAPHNRLSPQNDACFAAGCHPPSNVGADLMITHSQATTTVGGVVVTSCLVCHAAGVPTTRNCVDCHPDKTVIHGYQAVTHTALTAPLTGTWPAPGDSATYSPPYAYSATCSDCHSMLLGAEHAKPTASSAGMGCATCHPTPRNTFTTWNKSCTQAGCHTITGTAHYASGTAHAMAQADIARGCGFVASNGRRPCHYQDIVQEHNRTVNLRLDPNTYQPVLEPISVSCVACHNSAAFTALNGTWDGTCDACHNGTTLQNHTIVTTARYATVYAEHGAVASNTMDAHGWIRANPDQNAVNKTLGCGIPICHSRAYVGGGWPFPTNVCTDCH
jgi:hypothetical protein